MIKTVVRHVLLGHHDDAVQICLLAIPANGFSDLKFEEHGIKLPSSIARSVLKRRAEFFYGRLATSYALAEFGLAQSTIEIGKSRQPLWPSGIIGSITHNERYAAAIALDQRRHRAIGIDLESIIPVGMQDALLSTVISPKELDYLRGLKTSLPLDFLLTLVFSAKESFFKASFPLVGRYFDFDAVALSVLEVGRGTLKLEIREYLCAELVPGDTRLVHYNMIDSTTILTSCEWLT